MVAEGREAQGFYRPARAHTDMCAKQRAALTSLVGVLASLDLIA
jgi:hypothetical protein